MKEAHDELIDAILALRTPGSDAIPLNFLTPFDDTPLAGTTAEPTDAPPDPGARTLRLPRHRDPDRGQPHMRPLQSTAPHVANSPFLGDYLTNDGQATHADLEMIADAGFRVLSDHAPDGDDGPNAAEFDQAAELRPEVALRRRRAGTRATSNA